MPPHNEHINPHGHTPHGVDIPPHEEILERLDRIEKAISRITEILE